MRRKLHDLFGLKWNPFSPGVPTEALFESTAVRSFRERVEHLAMTGGYALVSGDPGTGKSATLRLLAKSLGDMPDVTVGILTRPQSSVFDFYREVGELFDVRLSPSNRWGGTKALRARWIDHLEQTGMCPVLVVDEAQQMRSDVLSEIRLLSSYMLDSKLLLLVILAGDSRLLDRLRTPDLLPFASRIRTRLTLPKLDSDELRKILVHAIREAGAPQLMSEHLIDLLSGHAGGNVRAMMNMGAELIDAAVRKNTDTLDDKLFFDLYSELEASEPRRRRRQGGVR